jgi:hypothetical protein
MPLWRTLALVVVAASIAVYAQQQSANKGSPTKDELYGWIKHGNLGGGAGAGDSVASSGEGGRTEAGELKNPAPLKLSGSNGRSVVLDSYETRSLILMLCVAASSAFVVGASVNVARAWRRNRDITRVRNTVTANSVIKRD